MATKKTVDDLLSELEEEEKNAEALFTEEITADEKTAGKKASEEDEDENKKTEKEAMDKKELKKKYEEAKKEYEKYKKMYEKEKGENEKKASFNGLSEEELVKIAEDQGKIMARSCYAELVAMGVMPPTNSDMAVPPVSEVSLPSDSPVTVAADAEYQMKGQGGGGKVMTEQDQYREQEKKASHNINKKEVLTNLYNQFFPKEEQ